MKRNKSDRKRNETKWKEIWVKTGKKCPKISKNTQKIKKYHNIIVFPASLINCQGFRNHYNQRNKRRKGKIRKRKNIAYFQAYNFE